MARIGDTINPSLGAIDYSGLAELYLQSSQQMGANIARGIDQIGEAIVQGRKDEAKAKADAKLIEEAKKYLPDNGYLNDIHAAITSKDTPLREKLALGESVAPLIELGIARYDADRDYKLRDRQVTIGEEGARTDRRRVDIAAKQYEAETATANATAADKNARALTDAVSVMQPLDDLLAAQGQKDDSAARKRVDSLLNEGKGPEALAAAKEWAEAARSELNRSLAPGGYKLDKIGVTTPDGLPGEQDVIVAPDGSLLDLQGGVIWSPQGPASQNQRPLRAMPAPPQAAPTKAGDHLPAPPPPSPVDAPAIANAMQGSQSAPQGIATPRPATVSPELLKAYEGMPAAPPNPSAFGQRQPQAFNPALIDAYAPYANGVLPNKDGSLNTLPVPGQRFVAPPRVGIRPMVSPKESPQEALAKSRQAAGDARLSETLKSAESLASKIPDLHQTKALLDESYTGFGAETITKAKRMLGQDVASAEQLQTLLGRQVLASAESMKGALSDRDLAMLVEFSAGMGKTAEGNRKVIEWQIKAAEQAQKVKQTIQEGFRTGKSPFEIEQEVERIRESGSLSNILKAPVAPSPQGIPQDEKDENAFFNMKPGH